MNGVKWEGAVYRRPALNKYAEATSSWLTPKRLRAHGLVLALCLWSVYLWNISSPGLLDRNGVIKGADFIHLYTLGSVALEHRPQDLYDADAQAAITARRVPAAAGIRYIPLYPPQISIFFAPLAALSYETALVIWLILNSIIYSLCCFAIWRFCPRLENFPWIVLLLALAFPGFFNLIVWGQTSAIALACFTATYFFLRDERPFMAGLALGCLIFKPQLGIAAAFIFTYSKAWKVIAGAMLSAAAQLTLPAVYYGTQSLNTWIQVMRSASYTIPFLEPRPYQTHSLRTFWTMLVPGAEAPLALYILSAIPVLGFMASIWSHKPAMPLAVRYSALLLASVLVSPHLIVYDLAVLAPAFLLLADWVIGRRGELDPNIAPVLYCCYLAPLTGPASRWTHLQISVVLMFILLYMIWRASRTTPPTEPA